VPATFDVLLRAVLLLVVVTTLSTLLLPTPDPFLVTVGGLAVVAVALAIGSSRRFLLRWLMTGRLRSPRPPSQVEPN
jgi:hypothetical protein